MHIKPLASVVALFSLSLAACLAEPDTADSESALGRRGRSGGDACHIHAQCVSGKHWEASSCSCVDDEPPPPAEEEEAPPACTPTECGPDQAWDDFFCGCVTLSGE